jgi:hypothetical protein
MYPVNMSCPEFTDSNMEKRKKKKGAGEEP